MTSQGEVCGHFVQQGPNSWQPLLHESTDFVKAIVKNDEAGVAAFLGQKPELLNSQLTLLYWGADPKAAGLEAGSKASVSVKHRTPLMLAAQQDAVGVLVLLLRQGADSSMKSAEDGVTAMQVAMSSDTRAASAVVDLLKEADASRQSAAATAVSCKPGAGELSSPEQAFGMDMSHFGAHQQDMEGDAYNPEGFPFSTSELTRTEYAADEFRMFHFKVSRCCKRYAHDWRACPFAHPTENARRRDPREFRYCSIACPEYKQGFCIRGDACAFAHGVFEGWLHPSRYRTQLCKDGANCHRPVCFFAHSLNELRTPTHTWTPSPEELSAAGVVAPPAFVPMAPPRQAPKPQQQQQQHPAASVAAVEKVPMTTSGPASAAVMACCDELLGANGFIEMAVSMDSAKAPPKPAPEAAPAYASPDSHGSAISSRASVSSGHAALDMQQQQQQPDGSFQAAAHQQQYQQQHQQEVYGSAGDGMSSAPAAAAPLLGFTAPRMSNAFARRHGLNPKDNAMINLQKLALQTQMAPQAPQQPKHSQWLEDSGGYPPRGPGRQQQGPRGGGRGGGRKQQQHMYAGGPQVLPGAVHMSPGPQAAHMYGMPALGYGAGMAGMVGGMMPGMHPSAAGDTASMAALNQSLMALSMHPQHAVATNGMPTGMAAFGGGMPQQGNGYHGQRGI